MLLITHTWHGITAPHSHASCTLVFPCSRGERNNEQDERFPVFVCSICIIGSVACCLIVSFALVLFSPGDIPDSSEDRDGSASSQDGGGGSARAVPQVTPMPATHKQKSFASKAPGLTGTPTTAKSREPVRFLCTVGPTFTDGMPLPKDGLCTLVFFDSVHAGGSNGLNPTRLPTNAMTFLQWAKNSVGQTTQFGVSFAIDDQNVEQEIKTKRFESGIDRIMAMNIVHFGFLNSYLSYASTTHIFKALNVLKGLDDYLKLKNIRTSSTVMALGVAPVYPSEFDTYVELMKQVFMPDLFVAIGHISYSDDGRQDCVILPPSVYAFPTSFTAPYGHTLYRSSFLFTSNKKRLLLPRLNS
ncbi:uncharacterized protein LOC142769167 [Rhipicephalus microplus]|uniref:uncharacterized protein LOC142769167 n=1 Tax=Rhipicephalus microplus TaxID=6941 RepID=UPI003F6D8166